jgi:hypothetical protein
LATSGLHERPASWQTLSGRLVRVNNTPERRHLSLAASPSFDRLFGDPKNVSLCQHRASRVSAMLLCERCPNFCKRC